MPVDRPNNPGRQDNRKSSKPAMERRRRQRINKSLSDLKTIIVDSMKKSDGVTQNSKLEKADILEMTVRHLHSIQRREPMSPMATSDSFDGLKFRAGFAECIHATCGFLSQSDGISRVTLGSLMAFLEATSRSNTNLKLHNPPYQAFPPHQAQQGSPTVSPSSPTSHDVSLRTMHLAGPPPPPALVPHHGIPARPLSRDKMSYAVHQHLPSFHSYHADSLITLEGQPLDNSHEALNFSRSFLNGSIDRDLRQSVSPDSARSCSSSEAENVWRPW